MSHWFAIYRWPLLAFAVASMLVVVHFIDELLLVLADGRFWAENLVGLTILSALIAWLLSLSERERARRERLPYTGWRIIVYDGVKEDVTPLYWRDAQEIVNSPIKRWQTIKSVLTTLRTISNDDRTIAAARKRGWLTDPIAGFENEIDGNGAVIIPAGLTDKTIRIDLEKLDSLAGKKPVVDTLQHAAGPS